MYRVYLSAVARGLVEHVWRTERIHRWRNTVVWLCQTPIIILILLLIIITIIPLVASLQNEKPVFMRIKNHLLCSSSFPVVVTIQFMIFIIVCSLVSYSFVQTPIQSSRPHQGDEIGWNCLHFVTVVVFNMRCVELFFVFAPISYRLISSILFIYPNGFHTLVCTFDKVHYYFLH